MPKHTQTYRPQPGSVDHDWQPWHARGHKRQAAKYRCPCAGCDQVAHCTLTKGSYLCDVCVAENEALALVGA